MGPERLLPRSPLPPQQQSLFFLPVIFVQSIAGQLLKELGLTISYSLLAALLVALTVIPMLAAKLLKREKPAAAQPKGGGSAVFGKMQARYGKLLNRALSKKTAILAIVLVLVIISVVIYLGWIRNFCPVSMRVLSGVQAMLPAGLSLETTLASIEKIEQDLLRIPEVRSVAIRAGDQGEMDVMSLMTGGMGLENAEFYISLAPPRAAQTIVKADHF